MGRSKKTVEVKTAIHKPETDKVAGKRYRLYLDENHPLTSVEELVKCSSDDLYKLARRFQQAYRNPVLRIEDVSKGRPERFISGITIPRRNENDILNDPRWVMSNCESMNLWSVLQHEPEEQRAQRRAQLKKYGYSDIDNMTVGAYCEIQNHRWVNKNFWTSCLGNIFLMDYLTLEKHFYDVFNRTVIRPDMCIEDFFHATERICALEHLNNIAKTQIAPLMEAPLSIIKQSGLECKFSARIDFQGSSIHIPIKE